MAGQIYEIIQKQVLDKLQHAIESGEKFYWVKPWKGGAPFPCSYFTYAKPFSCLLNQLFLDAGEYITFSKIKELQNKHPELGIKLKKGSKAVPVYQTFPLFKKDKKGNYELDKEGNMIVDSFSFRYVNEFHIEDVEGLKSHFEYQEFNHTKTEDMLNADNYIQAFCNLYEINVQVEDGSSRAFYRPSNNSVTLPSRKQFESQYEYYSTVFHEIAGHGTGKICGREMKNGRDKEKYALEELVAEITAATACAHFKIYDDASQDNSVAYLQGWMEQLKGEPAQQIKLAADMASKAFETFLQAFESPEVVKQQQAEPMIKILNSALDIPLFNRKLPLSLAEYRIPAAYKKFGTPEEGVSCSITYLIGGVEKTTEFCVAKNHTVIEALSEAGNQDIEFLNEHLELSKIMQSYQTYFRYHRDLIPAEKSNAFMEALGKYIANCRTQINLGEEIHGRIPKLEDMGINVDEKNMKEQCGLIKPKRKRGR